VKGRKRIRRDKRNREKKDGVNKGKGAEGMWFNGP
jgi:hypothetical protein